MSTRRSVRLFGTLCLVLVMLPLLCVPGGMAVSTGGGRSNATGRVTSIAPSPPQVMEQMRQEGHLPPNLLQYRVSPSPIKPQPLLGNVNLLVVLVDFTDIPGTVTNLALFDNLLFAAPVSGRGSVRDYYDEVTRSAVTIATLNLPSSTSWLHAANTMAYYADGSSGMGGAYPKNAGGMVASILWNLDPLVDLRHYDNNGDGQVDALLVIHAGTGAEWSLNANHIRSHASSISSMGGVPYYSTDGVLVDRYITVPEYWEPGLVGPSTTDMTIGVICHEIAHGLFGLPDLYDLDGSSNGIGQWGLMSYGDWNGPAKWNSFRSIWVTDGSSPAWPEAWSRVLLGWDTATLLLGPWQNCLPPVETTANAVVRLKTSGLRGQEYFLIENRYQVANSYDQYLAGSGLQIWHVDEAFWSLYGGPDNNNECRSLPNPHCWGTCATSHYLLALEQADGNDDLENLANPGDTGDPFPGSSNNTSWRWYGDNPVNPESGTWYDSGCARDSCIELINLAVAGNNICFSLQQASCAEGEADLGDAPASDNHHNNTPMTAYHHPYVQAHFPTVFQASPPISGQGPRHHLGLVDSYLGTTTTVELNADRPPDQDGMTNISPTLDLADMDSALYGGDDGLHLPLVVAHCGSTTIPFTVTVVSPPLFGPVSRYINLWADWTRDGDWGDTAYCPSGPTADEWVFHNIQLYLPMGTSRVDLYPIISKATVTEDNIYEIWLRLSVADRPAQGPADGRGPVQGYDLGETEDYYLTLSPTLEKLAEVPPDPLPGDLITYHLRYNGSGNIVALGAVLSDVLPSGLNYLSSSPPGSYDPAARTITWTVSITPAQPLEVTLVVRMNSLASGTLTNTAYLLWGDTIWKRASFSFEAACEVGDPAADFTWTPPVWAGQAETFDNLSTGTPPLTFQWDLDGDGQPDSTDEDPTWQYAAPGDYTVTLTATNALGCDDVQARVVEVTSALAWRVYLPVILCNGP